MTKGPCPFSAESEALESAFPRATTDCQPQQLFTQPLPQFSPLLSILLYFAPIPVDRFFDEVFLGANPWGASDHRIIGGSDHPRTSLLPLFAAHYHA